MKKYSIIVTIFFINSLLSMDHTTGDVELDSDKDLAFNFIVDSFCIKNKLRDPILFKLLLDKKLNDLQKSDEKAFRDFQRLINRQTATKDRNVIKWHRIAGKLCNQTYSDYLNDIHSRSNWNERLVKLGISGVILQICFITIYFAGILPPLLLNC